MKFFQNAIVHLKQYCSNCTIAGLAYIANERLHFTERIFWFICIMLSAYGAYRLINQYRIDFQSKAVSIVYDSLPINSKVEFPAISICNHYYKDNVPERAEEFVWSACKENCKNYDFEMEGLLLMYIFPHLYHDSSIRTRCEKKANCPNCNKCLPNESRIFLEELVFNCKELFVECSTPGATFDCCKFFRPLITPYGKCFLLNSLQNNDRDSPHWFHKEFYPLVDNMQMTIVTTNPIHVTVLNNEDIPNLVMPGVSVVVLRSGQNKQFDVFIENMINDPDVRDVLPEYRKCRFPDEVLPTSIYKAHSFSTCLNDCIRMHQLRLCNCSMQSMVPKANADSPPCNLSGIYCLEKHSMIRPDAKNLLPWSNSNTTCECLPSCTENEVTGVYESRTFATSPSPYFTITIGMPNLPTESYRRQALRTRLDVVVTIGGIMGLFLGASILSVIEFFYHFVLWICSNFAGHRQQ